MKVQLKAENIKCNGCAHRICQQLDLLEGVSHTQVDVGDGVVTVEVATDAAAALARHKLTTLGYPEPGQGTIGTTTKSYLSCMIGRIKS